MSVEAAKIISKISGRKSNKSIRIMLGTVKSLSPLTVKFDDIGFDVNSLLVNSFLLEHTKTGNITSPVMGLPDANIHFEGGLSVGDRVAGTAIGGSLYVILCKVVKT